MTNVLEYLEEAINECPGKTAFTGEDGAFSFIEIYSNARSAGSFLCDRKITKKPVAVFMERSVAMITAFFAVIYGGNYYIPLDSEMPAFRIRLILETADPVLIISDKFTYKTIHDMGYGEQSQPYTDLINHPVNEAGLRLIRENAIDADPVYIIFTSGSTGMPKGVITNHRSVINYIENLSEVMNFSNETVFGMQVPLYVDACLKEIYPTLKFGASVYLISRQLFMSPVKLIEYINENKINTICWVVSALSMISGLNTLEKIIPETLHTIAFGSEVFPEKQYKRWRDALPEARFIHLYGPTEATGMSAYYEAGKVMEGPIPIGKPFKNTEIILLDDGGKIPADGEPGEICIRGVGLCMGYFKDPEKTKAVFVQNPLSDFPDIIYKTGDIGCRNEMGELIFISRRDHQIKHMGHRIELVEIEWAVSRCEGVQMACAVFDREKSRIILFYAAEEQVGQTEIAAFCKNTLPRYMMPYDFIKLDILPLTPNGKMDRAGLLEKYINTGKKMDELLNILKEIHPEVDYDTCDDLMDGRILDSFDIITLAAEINGRLGITVPAEEIVPENFNSYKTLKQLIERLGEEQ